jgi:hypothetical protein
VVEKIESKASADIGVTIQSSMVVSIAGVGEGVVVRFSTEREREEDGITVSPNTFPKRFHPMQMAFWN